MMPGDLKSGASRLYSAISREPKYQAAGIHKTSTINPTGVFKAEFFRSRLLITGENKKSLLNLGAIAFVILIVSPLIEKAVKTFKSHRLAANFDSKFIKDDVVASMKSVK
jgi:hypothetical protein